MMYDAEDKYADIIHLPHHVSRNHPQMSMADRAAQFSPFAALTGHDAYRNGWDNCEPDAEGEVIFSSFCWRQQYDESNTSSIDFC